LGGNEVKQSRNTEVSTLWARHKYAGL